MRVLRCTPELRTMLAKIGTAPGFASWRPPDRLAREWSTGMSYFGLQMALGYQLTDPAVSTPTEAVSQSSGPDLKGTCQAQVNSTKDP